ncbi:MAG: hypothetical protein GW805_04055 [Ignavibacteria bacterium]|nr:hypothetical protein [Ignavibacteria bacterium]NCS88928.1 hypothetical protein [Ignavibacteria bacterium]OIO23311.1 MAG: hypothetical protein AUJ54_01945 [Ignavibacteria bacterium CG1_02_37_35]PIX95490.1 MAG: hypothetical protein COZ25_00190 [Ignavibacteria bacterium CG_4_10_14_3_um_filter_37_18]PJC59162.1 MAG: hypothetical protein CO025_06990 [Ignavibacteria bacterium CG_4_9_14_0_2_um_filter_37_13]
MKFNNTGTFYKEINFRCFKFSYKKKLLELSMEWHRFDPQHDPLKLAAFLKKNGFKLIEPSSYDSLTGLLYAYRE